MHNWGPRQIQRNNATTIAPVASTIPIRVAFKCSGFVPAFIVPSITASHQTAVQSVPSVNFIVQQKIGQKNPHLLFTQNGRIFTRGRSFKLSRVSKKAVFCSNSR